MTRNDPAGAKRLALVRELLAIRQREIVPRLAGAAFGEAHAADSGLLTAHWRMGDGATLHLLANLSDQSRRTSDRRPRARRSGAASRRKSISPWSVFWRLGQHADASRPSRSRPTACN